jgi:hypothetical protein
MRYTPKSEVVVELNNPRAVNSFKKHIFPQKLYVAEGKLYKRLQCKSVTCQAHNNKFRELKLQKITKCLCKGGKVMSYEYQYYNVKDTNGRVIAISPTKIDLLTFAGAEDAPETSPEVSPESALEEVLKTPD